MDEQAQVPSASNTLARPPRIPWNMAKLVGTKPPLRPRHVWSIGTRLRIDDVAPSSYSMDRATVRQTKTGGPARFELTGQTRQAIDDYLRLTTRKPGQFLFASRGNRGGVSTRQYARLVQ